MKYTAILLALLATPLAAQRIVVAGGDLSLVPAYEAAGDKWLDAQGKVINSTYTDGLITYVKEEAGWNAVRVRLFVDPTRDSDPATCQDLTYVTALGARIKAAGMQFLLDIQYSDTWADVSAQSIPASWGFNATTATDVIATQVYDYTTEVLQTLKSNAATPDYVQIGNEISYGMLWRSKNADFCNISSYNAAAWTRFATLLDAGSRAVRQECPQARIVIHSERTADATVTRNFYTNLRQAGLADDAYDVIGLSYYPFWQGTLSQLSSTLSTLQSTFPDKEIQIVETGWLCNSYYPASPTYAASKFPWALSPAGQAAFLTDLIATLQQYPSVTGLYYWQPEECGNGSDGNTNRVMNQWDNRGFWKLEWKSGTHTLDSQAALMTIRTFIPEGQGITHPLADPRPAGLYYDLLGRPVNSDFRGLRLKRN